eukprot:CAMPEP_0119482040 /NCGR_PEP_ID=MMETSP1344-20130328/10082_1 /TAXON_ID=236787 /ORGANISM="Florenciella parvula, Strain CCMP2471" /LENGTH=37 /DNA_ID= /DNA_START= /DNA_END= /DNA_ORIENTATION=
MASLSFKGAMQKWGQNETQRIAAPRTLDNERAAPPRQ